MANNTFLRKVVGCLIALVLLFVCIMINIPNKCFSFENYSFQDCKQNENLHYGKTMKTIHPPPNKTDLTQRRQTTVQGNNKDPTANTPTKLLQLYREYEEYNISISTQNVLTDYPYYKVSELTHEMMKFLPRLKSPCFFVAADQTKSGVTFRCLPYLLLIGVAKCGTTDLAMKLLKHQQFVSATKEIGWWTHSNEFRGQSREYVNLRKYSEEFSLLARKVMHQGIDYFEHNGNKTNGLISNLVAMDASPSTYQMGMRRQKQWDRSEGKLDPLDLLPHQIHHLLPDAKIMFILREPGARALSSFNMHARNRGFDGSRENFHRIVSLEIQWFKTCLRFYSAESCAFYGPRGVTVPFHKGFDHAYISPGLYSIYIKRWLEVFPRQNIHFIKLETYSQDPISYINHTVLHFLDLQPYDDNALKSLIKGKPVYNTASYVTTMKRSTRKLIDDFLKPYNAELHELLGNEFVW